MFVYPKNSGGLSSWLSCENEEIAACSLKLYVLAAFEKNGMNLAGSGPTSRGVGMERRKCLRDKTLAGSHENMKPKPKFKAVDVYGRAGHRMMSRDQLGDLVSIAEGDRDCSAR